MVPPRFRHEETGLLVIKTDRILILDEQPFGRICSALVLQNGYEGDWAAIAGEELVLPDLTPYRLIITSYPYSRAVLEQLPEQGRALLVLADYACNDLLQALGDRRNCYFAVKPLNFFNFGNIIRHILDEGAGC